MKSRSLWNMAAATMALGLAGCATVNDKALRLFSSEAQAFAIVNGQLLQGKLALLPDRTGNLSLTGSQEPITSCSGLTRYESSTAGSIDLRCNDGTAASLRYSLLSETRGYAYGVTAAGAASVTFGMAPAQAAAYLTVPPGKKLTVAGEGLDLQ